MKREVRQVTPEDVKKAQAEQVRMKEFKAINLYSSDSELSEAAFDPTKIGLRMADYVTVGEQSGILNSGKALFFPSIRDEVQKEHDNLLLQEKADHSWYRDVISPEPKAPAQPDVSWYHIAVDPMK